MNKCFVVIPARIDSTRLQRKVLLDIKGKPMIAHVIERAIEGGFENPVVACCSQEIADVALLYGAIPVITDPNLRSGSDRVWSAINKLKTSNNHNSSINNTSINNSSINNISDSDIIINLQADIPFFDSNILKRLIDVFEKTDADIVTPVALMKECSCQNENRVKVALEKVHFDNEADNSNVFHDIFRAMYFSRSPIKFRNNLTNKSYEEQADEFNNNSYNNDSCNNNYAEHIGIYAYRMSALRSFVNAKESNLEKAEKLEQLRALSIGLKIYSIFSTDVPISVDNQNDLDLARSSVSQ